jgi:hypothetical protein
VSAIASFATAYNHVRDTLRSTRASFAALDDDKRHWIDGSVHAAFHPKLAPQLNLPPLADLFGDEENKKNKRLKQRTFSNILESRQWLDVKAACDAFDDGNRPSATVPRRESSLFVSCSQAGSGSWLLRLPDVSLKGSVKASATFVTMLQRRLGLYVSALTAALDARSAAGRPDSQHERLGDLAANAANATAKHNAGLACVYRALVNGSEVGTSLQLGDRGDGTPQSKQDALARWDHVSPGYVPDVIERDPFGDAARVLYEFKSYTPLHVSAASGTRGGPCTSDGADVAFGNTLEKLRAVVLGHDARDPSAARCHDRQTGEGSLKARRGQYAGALALGHRVVLLATESTGAFSTALVRLLRRLASNAARGDASDRTVYGAGRASPRDFTTHHAAAISAAIVTADAAAITAAAHAHAARLDAGQGE